MYVTALDPKFYADLLYLQRVYNYLSLFLQSLPEEYNEPMRFTDDVDRLYIATYSFDPNWMYSDSVIYGSDGLIYVLSKAIEDPAPHVVSNSDNIRLFWRTGKQNSLRDTTAVGFRLLVYPVQSKTFS